MEERPRCDSFPVAGNRTLLTEPFEADRSEYQSIYCQCWRALECHHWHLHWINDCPWSPECWIWVLFPWAFPSECGEESTNRGLLLPECRVLSAGKCHLPSSLNKDHCP
jgi:hypothetical protein